MYCLLENVENHAYLQKLFCHELRFQESPGTISRSALFPPAYIGLASIRLTNIAMVIDKIVEICRCT